MRLVSTMCGGYNEVRKHICRGGGTGRRDGLKIRFPLRECGFDSHPRYADPTLLLAWLEASSKGFIDIPKVMQTNLSKLNPLTLLLGTALVGGLIYVLNSSNKRKQMKLEDTIDKDVIIGIPSGEVLSVPNIDTLQLLKSKKLVWIRVVGTNKFVFAFEDRNLEKIKKIL